MVRGLLVPHADPVCQCWVPVWACWRSRDVLVRSLDVLGLSLDVQGLNLAGLGLDLEARETRGKLQKPRKTIEKTMFFAVQGKLRF